MKKQHFGNIPVSQRSLAAYLGVSVTLLSMINTGRHGTRQLGALPAGKREQLYLAQLEAQKAGPGPMMAKLRDHSAKGTARLAKVLTADASLAKKHIAVLQIKLAEMIKREEQDHQWLNSLHLLLSGLPNTKQAAGDRIWLEQQQQITLERLQKNGSPVQVKLQLKLEMEKAKVRVYGEILKRLSKK